LGSAAFDPFSLSLPLQVGASDATFARIWPTVERVKDAFEPDYVLIQCGVDGLAGDPCAIWNWSLAAGEGSMGWCITRIVNEWTGKKLFLGGGIQFKLALLLMASHYWLAGGYNSPNAARAWAYLTSIAVRGFFFKGEMLFHSTSYSSGNYFRLKRKYLTIRPSRCMGPHSLWTFLQETCRTKIRMSIYEKLKSATTRFYK
jgi:hypothetical protein